MLLQALITGIHTFSFAFFVVSWLDEFKVLRSQLMLIMTVSLLACAVFAPFCGIALDKYRARWVICFGIASFALGLVLVSIANSHWVILLLYGVSLPLGVLLCGQLGCQALISRWFVHNRGAALGISSLGVALGGLLMPPAVTAMLAVFSWRETFQLLSVGTLLLVPAAWTILNREPDTTMVSAADLELKTADIAKWTTAKILSSRDFWIVVACFGALPIAYLPVLHSTGVYAHDLGIAPQQAALIASTGAIALGAGKFMFGKLADSIELRWLYMYANIGILLAVVGVGMANSWPFLMASIALISLCFGAYMPLLSFTIVGKFGSASFGRVLGLAISVIQIGTVTPFVSGLLQEATGSYMVAFLLTSSPLLISMLFIRRLSPHAITA